MHHLRLLGTIDLRDSGGREVRAVLQQPKRLALLAWFALAAGDHYVRRDTLLALFWPELNESKARAALRRAVYFLRQALGDGMLEGRGDEELRLGAGQLTCDVVLCRAALAGGDTTMARSLYSGELLAGFYIAGAPDAEEWLEQERRMLRDRMEPHLEVSPQPAPATLPVAHRIVAILPFAIHTDGRLDYLAEGLRDLCSTALDGIGDYRVLAPHAVPEGATHTLTGSLVALGGQLRLTAQLSDDRSAVIARAQATGDSEADLLTLVDDLVRQLIVTGADGPPGRMIHLATQTTASWPALRLWLAGEQEFRAGRYLPALDAYNRAAALDPAFALAHYRGASASAALAMIGPARAASARALPHRGRLSDRDRLLLDAQHAWLHGQVEDAELRYRTILDAFPSDVEAWSLLGDLLLHHNPYRGRSIREARAPLEAVLRLDPDHLSTLTKIARLDALEGQADSLTGRVDRIVALSPAGDRALGMQLLRAVVLENEEERRQLTGELRDAPVLSLAIAFTDAALYGRNPAAIGRLGHELTGMIRDTRLQGLCRLVMAGQAAGTGDLQTARTHFGSCQATLPAWELTVRALLHALPFLPWSDAEIARTRGQLEAWDPAQTRSEMTLPLSLHNELLAHLRAWLIGLLAARDGDLPALADALELTSELPAEAEHGVVIEHLERSLSAELRWLRGDAEGALQELENAPEGIWFQYAVASPLYCGAHQRWRRSELLRHLGRVEEARLWRQSLVERSPWELAFLSAGA